MKSCSISILILLIYSDDTLKAVQIMPDKPYSNKDAISRLGPRAQKTRSRILATMQDLLAEKEYMAITTAELAKQAEVNEGLIYHYFKSKDDVFWSVLEEYMIDYIKFIKLNLQGIKGTLNKLRKFIWANIYILSREHHPGGKILLLEVRNNPNYYKTPAFELTVRSREIGLEIIQEGIACGDISELVNPHALTSTIIGALEHAVMPIITHKKTRDPEQLTDQICTIIFQSITKKDELETNLIKKMDKIEKEIKKLKGGTHG